MLSIRKHFLKEIRESWAKEFPFLKPVQMDDVPKTQRGADFLCDAYADMRKRYYFIYFSFPPKQPGEFTMGATVSDSARKSVQEPLGQTKLSPFHVGSYSIGVFLNRQTRTWALEDVLAKREVVRKSLGIPTNLGGFPSPYTWKPSSYDIPLENIITEAIADVNEHLRTYVFPKLEIDYRKLKGVTH